MVETLYRNKSSLEAIFRIIDKDNSGKKHTKKKTIVKIFHKYFFLSSENSQTSFLSMFVCHLIIAGYISLDEFSEACNLIKKHMPCEMTHEQLEEICRLMDLNKDGQVDLNEFLESFRMVDPESRKKNQPGSPEPKEGADPNTLQINTPLTPDESSSPPISPAMIKPLHLLPKIAEEKKDTNSTSPVKSQENSVSVMVHTPPEEGPQTNSVHTNNFQMSPVLSSRRGSQI